EASNPDMKSPLAAGHRLLALLAAGAVVLGIALVARPRLAREWAIRSALAHPDLDSETLATLLPEASAGQARVLQRFWKKGGMPHRIAVLRVLAAKRALPPELAKFLGEIFPEASLDPDENARELAFGLLHNPGDDQIVRAAGWQLAEADPVLRKLGLQQLRQAGDLRFAPLVLPMLDDPDPTVVLAADSTLRRWSGHDAGLRMADSPMNQSQLYPTQVNAEKQAKLAAGVIEWKRWWDTTTHPANLVTNVPSRPAVAPTPCPRIVLNSVRGETVDIGSFRGRTVLLNFWATWCPACLVEMPVLVELQSRHTNDLVIIGISLDNLTQGPLAELVKADDTPESQLKTLRRTVGLSAARHRVNYPILLDPENSVGQMFNGGELPTNVLIDATGNIRRRFIGERSLEAWEKILASVKPVTEMPAK
ncbi:MAG TPA: TlpA disulfide reductase family protein, partial [Verrucomicrobiae bacterium]|nr:TlpA disulfide reductase family protein [Verrucomicrobiae bacterium]